MSNSTALGTHTRTVSHQVTTNRVTHLGAESPLAGVRVPLHDDPLQLGADAVVAGGHCSRGHESDRCGTQWNGAE